MKPDLFDIKRNIKSLICTSWSKGSLSPMINTQLLVAALLGDHQAQTWGVRGVNPIWLCAIRSKPNYSVPDPIKPPKAQGAPLRVQSCAGHLWWDGEEPLENPEIWESQGCQELITGDWLRAHMKNNRCEAAASLQAALWPINIKLCLAGDYAPNMAGRLKKNQNSSYLKPALKFGKAPNYESSVLPLLGELLPLVPTQGDF